MPSLSTPFDGVSGVFTPPRRYASPFQPPPLSPLVLKGYKSDTPPSAQLLSRALAEEIRLLIPPILQLVEDWSLIYSLEQDGVSLATLYKKCENLRGGKGGFVLVVRDGSGGVCLRPISLRDCPKHPSLHAFSKALTTGLTLSLA
jgi:hypothetical protein